MEKEIGVLKVYEIESGYKIEIKGERIKELLAGCCDTSDLGKAKMIRMNCGSTQESKTVDCCPTEGAKIEVCCVPQGGKSSSCCPPKEDQK